MGLSGAGVLLALLWTPLPPAWHGSALFAVLEDLVHGPLFAAAACFVLWLGAARSWRGYVVAWVTAALLALGTEYIQGFLAREPSWLDVRTDVLGATLGLAGWALWLDGPSAMSNRQRTAVAVLAVVVGLLMIAPAFGPTADWIDRERRFPVLFGGEFRSAIAMTESMTEDRDVRFAVQDGALAVDLLEGPLPGVVISKFAPDWRGYRSLVVEVENPEAVPLPLEVHVRDRDSTDGHSDRFTAQVRLAPGQRSMLHLALSEVEAAPQGRRMRMDALLLVAIYRIGPGSDRFRLHAIRLE